MLKRIIYFLGSIFLLASCSLKYDDTLDVGSRIPELIFQDTVMTRYEDNEVTVEMNAEVLEQYKKSSESFAQNVEFISYNDDGEIDTEGSCGYLFTDTKKEIYELYDDIELYNRSENTNFFANVLRWNAKTEQLTSGRGDMVRIEKEDAIIRGTGFSASGISKDFSFRGTVSGDIETKDSDESESEE